MPTATQPIKPLPEVSGVTFKPIPGFPDYVAGDDGSIWSKRMSPKRYGTGWRRLKGYLNDFDYLLVVLYRNEPDGRKTRHFRRISRMILEVFVGPCPKGQEACHYPNNDRQDNRLANLMYATHRENILHSVEHGTHVSEARKGKRPEEWLSPEALKKWQVRRSSNG